MYTYAPGRGWELWNMMSSIGAVDSSHRHCLFCLERDPACVKGERAGDDPWDAWTLEWTTTSPPPEYNFETDPEVRSSRPLWDLKHPDDPDWKYE